MATSQIRFNTNRHLINDNELGQNILVKVEYTIGSGCDNLIDGSIEDNNATTTLTISLNNGSSYTQIDSVSSYVSHGDGANDYHAKTNSYEFYTTDVSNIVFGGSIDCNNITQLGRYGDIKVKILKVTPDTQISEIIGDNVWNYDCNGESYSTDLTGTNVTTTTTTQAPDLGDYKLQYYYYFRDLKNDNLHKVELYKLTPNSIVASEVKTGGMPFSVELPELDNKFQPVRGKGCEINLISETNMQFFKSLYHVNMRGYIVKHYINSSVNYIGYLTPEMLRESYSYSVNYPFQLTGNDGFAILERIFFQSNGQKITGLLSQFDILNIIFELLGLPFGSLKICLTTSITNISSSNTILHDTYIDCANYYNEDDEPENLRTVLESILLPYGAFITQDRGDIIITDNNNLAKNNSFIFKKYSMNTWTYTGTESVNNNHKEISDIGYALTGGEISQNGGINRQVISYSPYPLKEILPLAISTLSEFASVDPYFEEQVIGEGNSYFTRSLSDNDFMNVYSPGYFQQSYSDNENSSNVYIGWNTQLINTKIADYILTPNVTLSGYKGIKLNITGEVLGSSIANPYNNGGIVPWKFKAIKLYFKIKVGDLYYNSYNLWTTNTISNHIYTYDVTDDSDNEIQNRFVSLGTTGKGIWVSLPSDETLSGPISLEIWSDYKVKGLDNNWNTNNKLYSIWIKNLKVEVINVDGESVSDDDIEYIGNLDELFYNKGDDIRLICGTDSTGCDRAKLLYYNGSVYNPISSWTRNGQSSNIESLLLNSYCSNYKSGFYTISDINLKYDSSLDRLNTYSILKDTSNCDDRIFMINNYVINYRDSKITTTLIEISQDILTIQL